MIIRELAIAAYTSAWTLWVYVDCKTRLHDMTAPGFFDDAIDMLAPGDVIYLVASDGVKQVSVHVRHSRIETEPLC